MDWAYGVVTVWSRIDTTLPQTLTSLKAAGFDQPRLFADDCSDTCEYETRYSLPTTAHDKIIMGGNHLLALWELNLRFPKADRYALFEDDILVVRNLRAYLESKTMEPKTYWNLYTAPVNQRLCQNRRGFYPSNQLGKGALALVFSREALVTLLGQPYTVGVVEEREGKAINRIDGVVVHALCKTGYGWTELVHNPSLVQHIGAVSAIGSNRLNPSPTFPGEQFDALSLLGATND